MPRQGGRASAGRREALRAWQQRIRDPSLTLLLALYFGTYFVAVPLAARGLSHARAISETLVLAVAAVVVTLSHRRGAIGSILVGFAAIGAAGAFGEAWPPAALTIVRRGGNILAFSALTWVVAHAVFAPGRITVQRLQGAIVVYLSLAAIFASAFALIWELMPGAFANLHVPSGGSQEIAALLYFSLTTLTTTGYGDIVPVDPFARSLANLESVSGVFYVAVTVARLVTLELEERRNRPASGTRTNETDVRSKTGGPTDA